ncbi:MAG: alpha/beta hydrolase [Thermoleophilaceae bacterium]
MADLTGRATSRAARLRRVRRRRRLAALSALALFVLAGFAVARHTIWPDKHGARTLHLTIASRYVHRRLGVSVVVPAGAAGRRPLLVFLHGRGGTENSDMRNAAMFAGLAEAGRRAPVIAFPYGGRSSYWHNRRDGRWSDWVVREVIPAIERRFHTDRRRIAIGGISMGGYGALEIARLHPGRFCAAGGHSPAIWQTGGETAAGAFDDAADFARHDLVGSARRTPHVWGRTRLWVDAGATDPFQPGDRAFVRALRNGNVAVSAHLRSHGGHEHSYWQRHWRDYVAFYARALARCRG